MTVYFLAVALGLLFLICALGAAFALNAVLDAVYRRFGLGTATAVALVVVILGVAMVTYPLARQIAQ